MSKGDTVTTHLERGRELRLENRLEEALSHFEAALHLDSTCARAHAGYGATLARLGHTSRAIEAYWESLRLQPVQPRIYGALANMYLEEGRADSRSGLPPPGSRAGARRRGSPLQSSVHPEFRQPERAPTKSSTNTASSGGVSAARARRRPDGVPNVRSRSATSRAISAITRSAISLAGAGEPPAQRLRDHALFQYAKAGFPHAAICAVWPAGGATSARPRTKSWRTSSAGTASTSWLTWPAIPRSRAWARSRGSPRRSR